MSQLKKVFNAFAIDYSSQIEKNPIVMWGQKIVYLA